MRKIFLGLVLLALAGCSPSGHSYNYLQKEITSNGGHVRIYGNPSFSSANIKQAADFNCQRYNRISANFTQAHAGAFLSGSEYSYWHYDCVNQPTTTATKPFEERNKIADVPKKEIQPKLTEEQIKISKMKPEDRHAYTCTQKFGFRKNSAKFKDCVFEMYKAETELEKLELQKKIIEANLELAKTRESAARSEQDRNNALLERQTLAQERTAAAAAQQARIADFESSQRMIDDGLALMRGDRNLAGQVRQPQQRLQTNCTFTGRFMSCF